MATQQSSTIQIMTVDVRAAKDLIVCGYSYLDVRTEEEFEKGHVDVENNLNIPYMFNTGQGRVKNLKFMEQILSFCNKDDPIIVVSNLMLKFDRLKGCQSGIRSVYATTDLQSAGVFLVVLGPLFINSVTHNSQVTTIEASIILENFGSTHSQVTTIEGFKHAYNMGGGYLAWVENGYATTKPKPDPIKLNNN